MATEAQVDVLNAIKAKLVGGEVPWHKPWVVRPECVVSHATGLPYSLRNRLLLTFAGEYCTVAQADKCGGRVNKGAKGHRVYFAKQFTKRKFNDATGEEEVSSGYVLRAYTVFHISDTTLAPKYKDKWGGNPAPDCDALTVVKDYCNRTGVSYVECGSEAFYSPSDDRLQVPNIENFKSEVFFWNTMFHELGHSTAKRLNRNCEGSFGSSAYAREELVAEITAALCLGKLGLNTEDTAVNSAAYIAHWQKAINKIRPDEFGDACFQAQKAFNLIFNIQQGVNNG